MTRVRKASCVRSEFLNTEIQKVNSIDRNLYPSSCEYLKYTEFMVVFNISCYYVTVKYGTFDDVVKTM